jgi:hypothetical protein
MHRVLEASKKFQKLPEGSRSTGFEKVPESSREFQNVLERRWNRKAQEASGMF